MNNNRIFWFLTLLVTAAVIYLAASFVNPESSAPASTTKVKSEQARSTETNHVTTRSAKDLKLDTKNNVKPDKNEEPAAPVITKEALEEKYKNFRDEGRKNFEEAVGGNWARLRKVMEANPEIQQLWMQQRELRDKWATMSDEEKPAALEQMAALREKGLGLLKAEFAKPETPDPATATQLNSDNAERACPTA
jgi:Na+-transporting methylmalonyl-CoA/oxaloacetate decarboxylase gamma subunit